MSNALGLESCRWFIQGFFDGAARARGSGICTLGLFATRAFQDPAETRSSVSLWSKSALSLRVPSDVSQKQYGATVLRCPQRDRFHNSRRIRRLDNYPKHPIRPLGHLLVKIQQTIQHGPTRSAAHMHFPIVLLSETFCHPTQPQSPFVLLTTLNTGTCTTPLFQDKSPPFNYSNIETTQEEDRKSIWDQQQSENHTLGCICRYINKAES